MPKTRLNKLVLKSIRGATTRCELPFDPNKKITMIFGENGSGKSTIVDAFSFLCRQEFGSLVDRSGASADYFTSVGSRRTELLVELHSEGTVWTARLQGRAGISVQPDTSVPDAHILRRARILRLVELQPAKRFEELATYINISGVERSEASLREEIIRTDKKLVEEGRDFNSATETINSLWADQGRKNGNAQAWAETERNKDLSVLNATVVAIDNTLIQISSIANAGSKVAQEGEKLISAESVRKEAEEDLLKQAQEVAASSNELVTLLESFRQIVWN